MTDRPGAAYIDATAGVAGDMLLGALLDAGADAERVRGAIASLGVPGLGLRTEAARRGGLACLRAVITTPTATDCQRHLADVLGHVGASDLRPAGKDLATRVFRLLAEAEGAVHGEPPEDVHFHEVGAFDSLADVVGSAAALEDLGLLRPGAVVAARLWPPEADSSPASTAAFRCRLPPSSVSPPQPAWTWPAAT